MRTIITDLNDVSILKLKDDDNVVNNGCSNCIGCFKCWTKNHYNCILPDEPHHNGTDMLNSNEIIIITKCVNGCYSSAVKKILERSINFVKPHFKVRKGRIHHYLRSDKKVKCHFIIYGDMSLNDKKTIEKLINANYVNFYNWLVKIDYVNKTSEIGELI